MARVRISDVATAAGVSTATVSLVLNDRVERISPATAARVRQAAAAVGYTPNTVARGLRTQRTHTLGLISDTIATTPFAGRMLAGAQDAAREHGYLVFLVDTDADPKVEEKAIRALVGQQVDAMIYAAMWHRVVEAPAGLPTGTVFLDCRPSGGGFPAVVPDDRQGGVAAVRELVAADTGGSRTWTSPRTSRPSPPACATRATWRCSRRRASPPTPPCTPAARPPPRAGAPPSDGCSTCPPTGGPRASSASTTAWRPARTSPRTAAGWTSPGTSRSSDTTTSSSSRASRTRP